MQTIEQIKPSIWAGSLSAYNNGTLLGEWLAPEDYQTYSDFDKAIKKVTKNAEEVAIMDYDNCPDFGEYPCIESLYDFIVASKKSNVPFEALIKYAENQHISEPEDYINIITQAEDSYCGIWDNFQEYSDDFVDSTGMLSGVDNGEPASFFCVSAYFDYHAFARDLELDYSVFKLSDYKVAIFHNI